MHTYYRRRKSLILFTYRFLTKWAKKNLHRYYDKNIVKRVSKNTLQDGKEIISRLPYIGGRKNAFTSIIILNGWFISFYRAMKKENIDITIIAYINRAVTKKLFHKIPSYAGKYLGRIAFKDSGVGYFWKQANQSQKKEYPADFVYTFNIVTDWFDEREIEFKFEECAVHKFYDAEKTEELKQYCNFADPLYSEYFDMGVNADHTMAQGCDVCILNYNNRRATKTPLNITQMIQEAEKRLGIRYKC